MLSNTIGKPTATLLSLFPEQPCGLRTLTAPPNREANSTSAELDRIARLTLTSANLGSSSTLTSALLATSNLPSLGEPANIDIRLGQPLATLSHAAAFYPVSSAREHHPSELYKLAKSNLAILMQPSIQSLNGYYKPHQLLDEPFFINIKVVLMQHMINQAAKLNDLPEKSDAAVIDFLHETHELLKYCAKGYPSILKAEIITNPVDRLLHDIPCLFNDPSDTVFLNLIKIAPEVGRIAADRIFPAWNRSLLTLPVQAQSLFRPATQQ